MSDVNSELYKDVQEIKKAVKGNMEYGYEGYKQRIERLERQNEQLGQQVKTLAETVDKIYHIAIGAGMATSFVVSAIAWLIINWSSII